MKNNNQINVPQAREAMDRFKMQAAQEVGVNLQNGYNGHLTSREAGSVGGQMVKKIIEAYEQGLQEVQKIPLTKVSGILFFIERPLGIAAWPWPDPCQHLCPARSRHPERFWHRHNPAGLLFHTRQLPGHRPGPLLDH